jgi:hypothetical protein
VRFLQSFGQLAHLPLVVDLTVEENARLKVLYGSHDGFHAIDLDSAAIYDIYTPSNVRRVSDRAVAFLSTSVSFQTHQSMTPHCVVILPNSNGMQLLLCYDSALFSHAVQHEMS